MQKYCLFKVGNIGKLQLQFAQYIRFFYEKIVWDFLFFKQIIKSTSKPIPLFKSEQVYLGIRP